MILNTLYKKRFISSLLPYYFMMLSIVIPDLVYAAVTNGTIADSATEQEEKSQGHIDKTNTHSQPELVPLWAIDFSLIAVSLDAYPGSSFRRSFVAPYPNFRLNSPYLQTSGGSVNARLFNSPKLDLGLTFGGTLPTKNKHLEVRRERNLPDLDPSVEVGLSLKYIPYQSRVIRFKTELPVRKATGLALQDQDVFWKVSRPIDLGWTVSPRFVASHFFGSDKVKYELDLELGSKYATQQNMNFFYGVAQEFADVLDEEEFLAEQGLVNTWAGVSLIRKSDKWRLSLSARYSDLHRAENILSPLLEEKEFWLGFMSLTYTYAQSNLLVAQDSEFRN